MSEATQEARTVETIEADAAQVRADLAQTLDELTHRVEASARSAAKVAAIAGAGVAALVAAIVVWRRVRG